MYNWGLILVPNILLTDHVLQNYSPDFGSANQDYHILGDMNIREPIILGLAGAVWIGPQMRRLFNTLEWPHALLILVVILIIFSLVGRYQLKFGVRLFKIIPSFTTPLRLYTLPIMTEIHETEGPSLPLTGIRVIEFCHILMGPTCGMVLGDLGADVIKVEPLRVILPVAWDDKAQGFLQRITAIKKVFRWI